MSSVVRRTRYFSFCAFLTTLLAAMPFAGAQNFRGGINGTVTDQGGATIPGAQVQITDDGTGVTKTTVSSSAGEFDFPDLPLGTYTVTATDSGFETLKVQKVPVSAGSIYSLPMKLAVASQATTVEVNAAGLALDTTTPTETTVLSGRTIQDIPLNGRDFTQMIGMAPGFAGYSLGGYGSVNGTRANQVNWQIDGSDNNDLWHNIPAVNQGGVENIAGITLPIDSVEEFSLQTQASPEAGRNPGGSVNLVTKSGTNQIHGSAYYYNRNEALAIVSPFQDGNPPLRNQQWGESAGGPFWKDHTFWFENFEKQQFKIATGFQGTEPSAAYQAQALPVLAYYGIPANAAMTNLLGNLWPAASLTGAATSPNYVAPAPETGYSYNGVIKLDHNFSDRQSISARAFLGQGNQIAPVVGNAVIDYYFEVAPIHVYNYSLVHNFTISSHLTNQVTIGVNYFNQVFSDQKTGFDVDALGFVTNSPYTQAPNITISGFEEIGNTPPEGRNDITGHLDEALSWIKGKHQFRFGGEFRQAQIDEFYQRHSTGSFKFTGATGPWAGDYEDATGAPLCTGYFASSASLQSACQSGSLGNVLALADFMAGDIASGTIARGDAERQVFMNTFDLFAQDSWQLLPNFSFDYGIRYDYLQPMRSDYQNLSVFRPELTASQGLAFQGNQISQVYPSDWANVSPRIGFSYSPEFAKGTVLRGGFGMFFDTPNANPFLDNRPGNTAPNGLEGNPGGANPVYTLATYGSTVVPGQSLFPVITPTTTSLCNPGSPCGVFSVDRNFKTPYNFNFSLQVEQSIGSFALFQVGYVGSQGRRLLSLLNINQPYLGGPTTSVLYGGQSYDGVTERPYLNLYPQYGDINQIESIGTSNYNSLQTIFKIRSYHGLTTQFSYTWGHNLDEVTMYRGQLPQDSTNFKGDYGNSDFDTRNGFVGYANYAVPTFRGPKLLTGGWELNTVITLKTGEPINLVTATDTTGENEYTQRPNIIGNPFTGITHSIQSGVVQWLNPAAFANPASGTYGNYARNSLYGPGFQDVDLSLFKNTKIGERINTQFRVEMFNIFNHLNLANPGPEQLGNDAYGTSSFAQIPSTIGAGNYSPGIGPGEPFNVQLALKILF
jgi:Carboxypeptidase regulatory-like domain/TonB dependent receptor